MAKLLEMVNERRVVQLLRVGWEAEPPCYVMEYLPGGSLADRMAGQPVTVDEAVTMFRGVAEALDYLHGKAILHCDLKPGNVLLDERHEVRLADFGQARSASESGPSLGTLFYMAPEQGEADSRPDVRADIYALGALAYAMLTGRAPYATATASEHLASSGTTAERVRRYRKLIDASPAPRDHRRAAGITKQLRVPILVDEPTVERARAHGAAAFRFRRLARLRPFGLTSAVTASELLPASGDAHLLDADGVALYEQALEAFIAGRWDEAFSLLHAVPPWDHGKDFLTGHILGHRREPPPGWDGVIALDSK